MNTQLDQQHGIFFQQLLGQRAILGDAIDRINSSVPSVQSPTRTIISSTTGSIEVMASTMG